MKRKNRVMFSHAAFTEGRRKLRLLTGRLFALNIEHGIDHKPAMFSDQSRVFLQKFN
jgi:hypothetical protein